MCGCTLLTRFTTWTFTGAQPASCYLPGCLNSSTEVLTQEHTWGFKSQQTSFAAALKDKNPYHCSSADFQPQILFFKAKCHRNLFLIPELIPSAPWLFQQCTWPTFFIINKQFFFLEGLCFCYLLFLKESNTEEKKKSPVVQLDGSSNDKQHTWHSTAAMNLHPPCLGC